MSRLANITARLKSQSATFDERKARGLIWTALEEYLSTGGSTDDDFQSFFDYIFVMGEGSAYFESLWPEYRLQLERLAKDAWKQA